MGRGGVLRPGLAALGLVMAVAAAGCGGSGDPVGASAGAAHSVPAPSATSGPPRPLSGTELCVSAVGYWAHEMLDGGEPYGDYQSMGLSNRQYDILRQVVEAARAAKRTQGVRAAEELIGRQTREACTERYRDGGPSRGPWRS
ncbi:hypothetical protein [Streptomyces coelicoflavus]|uniref:hypothetical protein n=1 Tax=Streptomyces coelicoflavus TaxID=285562 RepID=UPI00158270F4|nr:hypothetical protein [Streptomyces coelicoflavus]